MKIFLLETAVVIEMQRVTKNIVLKNTTNLDVRD
jgi:hypothetical protein